MAGEPLATWQAAEVIAAEGFSGRPTGALVGDRSLIEAIRLARRERRDGKTAQPDAPAELSSVGDDHSVLHASDVSERGAIACGTTTVGTSMDGAGGLRAPTEADAVPADAFALDARLNEAMGVIRTAEPPIGRLLRVVVDHRLYRALGYATLDGYVRERLGISMRKVWALAKVERATARSDDFARAYRGGRLSWVQALTLLPVLDRSNGPAWVARADTVTVRRLGDEVSWVLEARDVSGNAAALAPPPLDSRLTSPVASARRAVP